MSAYLVYPTIITLLGMGGFLIGASMSYFTTRIPMLTQEAIYAISSGLISGIVIFELAPEAWKRYEVPALLTGIMIGIVLISALESFFSRLIIFTTHKHLQLVNSIILIGIGISLHNLPLGISLGANLFLDSGLVTSLIGALLIHHIPEGLALLTPLIANGTRFIPIVTITFLLSLSLGVGSAIGMLTGSASGFYYGVLIGIALTFIAHIGLNEMGAKALRMLNTTHFAIYTLAGLSVCYLLISFVHIH